MRSFVKIKPSRNGDITLSFTDIGKSCPSHDFLTWQICLLTLFVKIKFLQKFRNLQFKSCLSDWSVLQVSVINQLSTCPQIILTRFAKNQSPLVLHLPGLSSPQVSCSASAWVKVFRINPEFRILRLTFHRKSASKS